MPLASLLIIAAIFLLGGAVKGVIGLGLPTVAIGLMSLTMTPAEAAAILLVPSFITNVWQALTGGRLPALALRLAPLLLGIVAGSLLGRGLMTGAGAERATGALGLALMIYAASGLLGRTVPVPPSAERWAGALAGVATGLITAATGVFVIPAVPYLQALGLTRDDLVQALGLSFTVSTLALGAVLALDDALPVTALAIPAAVSTATALAGMAGGQWLRRRVRPETFRLGFFLGLLALGLHLALRPLL